MGSLTAPKVSGVKPAFLFNVALLQPPAPGGMATSRRCCFKLKQFYFGRTTSNLQATLNAPLQCEVKFTAYGASNGVVSSQSFEPIPNSPTLSSINLTVANRPPVKLIYVQASQVTATLFE